MLLSSNTRKLILSIPFAREISNYIVNISNKGFYNRINKEKHFDSIIRGLRNTKKGKKCFIVGNGPSLTIDQLEAIKAEDCFGANRIYKIFEKTTWRPKYYVIQDRYDETKGIYETLDVEHLFVSDIYWKEHGMNNPCAICYHTNRAIRQKSDLPYSEDVSQFVQTASTVTYTMIQIATYMGYSELYLIGMDHTYANVTNDKGVMVQKNNIRSHVFEDEKPNEVVANISYMEEAYRVAKGFCEKQGIKIYNATCGGALEVFRRINFWDVIKEINK